MNINICCNAVPTDKDLFDVVSMVGQDNWIQLHNQHIFITGATGFVGRWLLTSLDKASKLFGMNCKVTILSREPNVFINQMPKLIKSLKIKIIEGDIETYIYNNDKISHFIHAASDVIKPNSPLKLFQATVNGTQRVLEHAILVGAHRMLYISSGAVYGKHENNRGAMPETYLIAPDTLLPESIYGESKRCSEMLCSIIASNYDIIIPVARCFTFVGPYLALNKQFAIGNFIQAAIAQKNIYISGDGTPYRTYLYATDMAIWLWIILFKGKNLRAYNVGGSTPISISDLAKTVISTLDIKSNVEFGQKGKSGSFSDSYVPDVNRAKEELGLIEAVTIESAISRTANWYRLNTSGLATF